MKADKMVPSMESVPSAARKPSPETYISDLNAFVFIEIANILDMNETWKKLFGVLPGSYYSARDLQFYEREHLRLSGSPSTSLLRDMGHKGFKVVDLVFFLERLQLERALVYVKEFQPVQLTRPLQTTYRIQGGPSSMFEIECPAIGFPRPTYQWFKLKDDDGEDWIELINQCSRVLSIRPVRLEDTGRYCCRFNNFDGYTKEQSCAFTDLFSVVVEREFVDVNKGEIEWHVMGEPPEIVRQPSRPSKGPFFQGSKMTLECVAQGTEPFFYEWYQNGKKMPGEECSELTFYVQPDDDVVRYTYQCRVWNEYGSINSDSVVITVSSPRDTSQFVAEDKVALLIANQDYNDHVGLRSAITDVVTVAKFLKQLDFKVLAAVNLDESEMRNIVDAFCKLLDSGVYGVFYYAGHGFETNNQCYMMPVDAPTMFTCAHCVCIEDVKASMQQRNPGLCCLMIDMCRKDCSSNLVMDGFQLYQSEVHRNLICFYATSYACSALDGPEGKNGLFVKHLKNYITKKIPIEEVLSRVLEDISVDPVASNKQFPSIGERTLAQTQRSLADKIHSILPNSDDRKESYLSLIQKPNNFSVRFNTELVTHVTFELEETVLCNSLEMKMCVTDHNGQTQSAFTSCLRSAEPTYMQKYLDQCLEGGQSLVTVIVRHLQKLKNPLTIYGRLIHQKRNVHFWDRSLGFPLISNVARHWETIRRSESNKLSYASSSATEDDESGIGSFMSQS